MKYLILFLEFVRENEVYFDVFVFKFYGLSIEEVRIVFRNFNKI